LIFYDKMSAQENEISEATKDYISKIERNIQQSSSENVYNICQGECFKFNTDIRRAFSSFKTKLLEPLCVKLDSDIKQVQERIKYIDEYHSLKADHISKVKSISERLYHLDNLIEILRKEGYSIKEENLQELIELQKQLNKLREFELSHLKQPGSHERDQQVSKLRSLEKYSKNPGEYLTQITGFNQFDDVEFKAKFIEQIKSEIDYRTIGEYLVQRCNDLLFKNTQVTQGMDITKLRYLTLGQENRPVPKEFSVLVLYVHKGFVQTKIWK